VKPTTEKKFQEVLLFMPKERSSNSSSNANSPKINESLALTYLGQKGRTKSEGSEGNNEDAFGGATSSVRVTQPASGAATAASGYVIFGGQVQIFNDEWKDRQPMSGHFEYKFFDLCWDRGDCLLAFSLPCIYDCLLVTGMSKQNFFWQTYFVLIEFSKNKLNF
jgi:hypothetical protein